MNSHPTKGAFKAKALQHFRKAPSFLNCAQSTLKGAEGAYPDASPGKIEELKASGGGRSEGGVCGAFHAARCLLKDAKLTGRLAERFIESGGSIRCKELRAQNRIPCEGCVALASDFLEEHAGASQAG